MDTPNDMSAPAPTKPKRPKRTPAQLKADMERQRMRRSKALVAEATTLAKGARLCKATSAVRDADGNKVLGPDGKALRRPCQSYAIKGGSVCSMHGGQTKHIKAAAQRRLLALVEPALVRLGDLIHQDTHLATSLGAIRTVLERAGDEAIGALSKKAETQQDTRPIINIGIKVGGIAQPTVAVGMRALPAGDDDDIEGEVVEDDGDD